MLEQYVTGLTLEQFCKNKKPNDNQTIDIVIQLCEGLEILHNKNIIHRDITPTNIMIDDYNVVKIIDFDISRRPNDKSKHDTHILGTEGYAAPEQFGFKQSTPQTDIYAVGAIINYIKTGKTPDEKLLNDGSILPDIIKKCIEFDPEKRYQNIKALLEDLNKYKYATDNKINSDEQIKKEPLLERIVSGLPGVRSRYKLVRIFAFINYFVFLFFIYDTIQMLGDTQALLKRVCFTTFYLIIPFFFYSNYLSFQDKIFTRYSHSVKRVIFNFLATVSVFAAITLDSLFK